MRVVTLPDRAYAAQARRFCEIGLPGPVANSRMLPTHAATQSMLRLFVVTCLGQNAEAAVIRIATLEAIKGELDPSEQAGPG